MNRNVGYHAKREEGRYVRLYDAGTPHITGHSELTNMKRFRVKAKQ